MYFSSRSYTKINIVNLSLYHCSVSSIAYYPTINYISDLPLLKKSTLDQEHIFLITARCLNFSLISKIMERNVKSRLTACIFSIRRRTLHHVGYTILCTLIFSLLYYE